MDELEEWELALMAGSEEDREVCESGTNNDVSEQRYIPYLDGDLIEERFNDSRFR